MGSNRFSTVYLERISPEIIVLYPLEKLIIEIAVTGRYADILWEKSGASLVPPNATLSNYDEILVIGETTIDDFGLYQVLIHSPPFTNQLLFPSSLSFVVTFPGACVY